MQAASTTATSQLYALLDDCEASSASPTSRLYTGHVRTHVCTDPAALDATWAAVEADQRAGLHAVLLGDYEWGTKLVLGGHKAEHADAALRVMMFRHLGHLSRGEVDAWLAHAEGSLVAEPSGPVNVRSDVSRDEFNAAIARIHQALLAGDSYQVNYTTRLDFDVFGSPVALYRRLRARQPVRYAALIALPDERFVLSLSPELFLRHEENGGLSRIIAKPMKGTAARAGSAAADAQVALALSADVKNRAENVMIVDLLRNDLGRIAEIGSVRVPAIFSVEPYPTVFQMTSTVEAQLRTGTRFPDVLRALFPCGSITGAPKYKTMQIIEEIERNPRGIYCGAIGWVDASATNEQVGEFCLSVAIRTLMVEAPHTPGLRRARLGVGAGIVLDSEAASEYEEVALKARFLTELDPGFALFETMLAHPADQGQFEVRHLDLHLARLARSAAALGFKHDTDALRATVREHLATIDSATPLRMRLALNKTGNIDITNAPLDTLPNQGCVVHMVVVEEPLQADAYLGGHKTTWRPQYDPAMRAAIANGWFDQLFFNRAGELVEGSRSNVFVKIDGRWFTPPLKCGALPGVMRSVLLADPAWAATERVITREEFQQAEDVVVCNALRGAVHARVVEVVPV
jgi:para-aminobenzoate synthetase/4-amino-4-deoxychorismate lyase